MYAHHGGVITEPSKTGHAMVLKHDIDGHPQVP